MEVPFAVGRMGPAHVHSINICVVFGPSQSCGLKVRYIFYGHEYMFLCQRKAKNGHRHELPTKKQIITTIFGTCLQTKTL